MLNCDHKIILPSFQLGDDRTLRILCQQNILTYNVLATFFHLSVTIEMFYFTFIFYFPFLNCHSR